MAKQRRTLLPLIARCAGIACVLVVLAGVAHAGADAGSGIGIDTPMGKYAAVGCGLFSRALGSGMVNVGVLAGAIATCAFMFIDAFFL
jgi:hypothetical protein